MKRNGELRGPPIGGHLLMNCGSTSSPNVNKWDVQRMGTGLLVFCGTYGSSGTGYSLRKWAWLWRKLGGQVSNQQTYSKACSAIDVQGESSTLVSVTPYPATSETNNQGWIKPQKGGLKTEN
ncbi:hypothetical protein LIER_21721 [Lithospermum erythrorhizon]|uniref:Uncharacterized protein n=1 Tax=Lithospermum erythrorhizon TaxID=34254 RepID=A0AAV3QTL6_LITER